MRAGVADQLVGKAPARAVREGHAVEAVLQAFFHDPCRNIGQREHRHDTARQRGKAQLAGADEKRDTLALPHCGHSEPPLGKGGQELQVRHRVVEPPPERAVHRHGIGAAREGLLQSQFHIRRVLLRRKRLHGHALGHVSQRVEVAHGQIRRAVHSCQGGKPPVHGDDRIEGALFPMGGKVSGIEIRCAN